MFNELAKGIMPVGIWDGFTVSPDGTISAGIFFSSEGVKIEETEAVSVVVPEGHATLHRVDKIVMRYEFEQSIPVPVATYEVIQGEPTTDIWPDLAMAPATPEGAYSLATAHMDPLGTEWTSVSSASKRVTYFNCYHDSSLYLRIINGAEPAMLLFLSCSDNRWFLMMHNGGEVENDGDISGIATVLSISADGVAEIINKMPLSGGTFSGPVEFDDSATFNDAATFNSEDPTFPAFDDWVTFTRHVPAAGANSADWVFANFYWRAITSGPGTLLIVPIPQYVGAELVSVDIDCNNDDAAISYDVEVGLSKIPYGDYASAVDFSEETFSIPGSTQEFNNLVIKDPEDPFGPLPYAFVDNEMLVLKLKTGADKIMFWGARFNYRRKQIAI